MGETINHVLKKTPVKTTTDIHVVSAKTTFILIIVSRWYMISFIQIPLVFIGTKLS